MRIRRSTQRPRLGFLFEPARALHVPSRCEWADVQRVEVRNGDWAAACRQLAADAPVEATLAFDPGDAALALREAPGLRIALVLDSALGEAAVAAHGSGAIDAFTWPERWTGDADARPFQILPPPLDEARLGAKPSFGGAAVLVPEWAAVPDEVRVQLAAARLLPAGSTLEDVAAAAEDAAALLWCTGGEPGAPDPRLLVALARGLLVLSDAPPPSYWALDVGDDLLVCAPADMPGVISRAAAEPAAFAPIRVRAWQRVRECFSSAAIERLVQDARTLLRRARPAGAGQEGR